MRVPPVPNLGFFSDLIFLHSLVGQGVQYDLPHPEGILITSAVSRAARATVTRAQGAYIRAVEESLQEDRDRVEALEKTLRKGKGDERIAHPSDGNPEKELRELKEKLRKHHYPTFPDPDLSRSSCLELMERSRYGAMTLTDPGELLDFAMRYTSKTSDLVRLARLTEHHVHASFLRSNSTAGSLINMLHGDDPPMLSITLEACSPSCAKTARMKMLKRSRFDVLRGRTAVVTTEANKAPMLLDGLQMLTKVFASEKDHRIQVLIRDRAKWEALLSDDWETHVTRRSVTAKGLATRSLCTFRNCVAFAARAAVVRKVTENLPSIDLPKEGRTLELTDEDFELAKAFAKALFEQSAALDTLDSKATNAATARRSFVDPAKVATAAEALTALLVSSEDNMVSWTQACRTEGITSSLLRIVIDNNPQVFLEVTGVENIKMGRCKRAVAFRGLGDAEECRAVMEASEGVSTEVALEMLRQLQLQAGTCSRDSRLGIHAVPLDRMTEQQLIAVTTLCAEFPDEVDLQEWTEGPEESENFGDIVKGSLVLWVRNTHTGEPARNWNFYKKNGLAEKWGVAPEDDEVRPPEVPHIPEDHGADA